MTYFSRFIVGVLVGMSLVGCATVETANHAHAGSPKVYGGTRLNVAALSGDQITLDQYGHYGINAPEHPGLDLPLSLVGDTLMLPFSLWYVLTEPVVGRP